MRQYSQLFAALFVSEILMRSAVPTLDLPRRSEVDPSVLATRELFLPSPDDIVQSGQG